MATPKKWFKQKNAAENALAALQNLVYQLEVPVTQTTLQQTLAQHAHPSSPDALGEALNGCGIANLAVRFDKSATELLESTFPAIAGSQKFSEPAYLVLTHFDGHTVTYIDPAHGWQREAFADFASHWTGVLLLVEATESAGELNYGEKRQQERLTRLQTPALWLALLALVGTASWSGWAGTTYASLAWLLLVFTKLAGVLVSLLLFAHKRNANNPLLNRICNSSNKTSCDSVLNSSAATIFGISWTEIGGLYFFAGLFTLVLGLAANQLPATLGLLAVLNLLALPYTFFSVYYQASVIKMWCPLCLAVQGLLWLELPASLLVLPNVSLSLTPTGVAIAAFGLLVPWLFWLVLKKHYGKAGELSTLEAQVAQLRKQPVWFKEALQVQRVAIEPLPNEVILGNPEAPHTITLFTDPFCSACVQVHEEAEVALRSAPDLVKLLVRFHTLPVVAEEAELDRLQNRFAQATGDERTWLEQTYGKNSQAWQQYIADQNQQARQRNQIAQTIVGLAKAGRTELAHKAMRSWYEQKNRSKAAMAQWLKAYAVPATLLAETEETLAAHQQWAEEHGIMATPTLFVDGQAFGGGVVRIADIKPYLQALSTQATVAAVQYEEV